MLGHAGAVGEGVGAAAGVGLIVEDDTKTGGRLRGDGGPNAGERTFPSSERSAGLTH